jgi:hypothetical protein
VLGVVQTVGTLTFTTFALLLVARFRHVRAWIRFCLYWAWIQPVWALLANVGLFAHPWAGLALTAPVFGAALLSWVGAGYLARRVGKSTRVWSVLTGLFAMGAPGIAGWIIGAAFRTLLGLASAPQ